jgi:DNA primase
LIPQSFIADLLNRIDIVDVVGQFVSLKKAGGNFQGLCPFHNEKSPSFSVSPSKQFYHCFGCGAHGSAIGFLMEYSGLSYVEAIEDLARSAGVDVPKEERRPGQVAAMAQSMALTEVMEKASQWYIQQLKVSPRAIEYLKGRGLSGEIAKRFGMGYVPDGWQGLAAVFGDYADDKVAKPLAEAGMLIQGEDDGKNNVKRYDRFRDRIMFPIRNSKGQVIAFGGRILDKGEPKYLNSPETTIFKKGQTLYGLFEGRKAIREMGYALVCEGYMDVVALAQLGFANAVATLGTACTSYHVQALMRQTEKIVFSFDGDKAGQRAAKRALEACLPMLADDKEIRFLFLPTEHDPDSYVREKGEEAFAQAIKAASPLSAFLIQVVGEDHDWETAEGRAQAQSAAKPYFKAMPAIALRSQILRELAARVGSSQAELEKFYGLENTPAATQSAPAPKPIQDSAPREFPNKFNQAKPAWKGKDKVATRNAEIAKQKPIAPTDLAEQLMRIFLQFPMLAKNLSERERKLTQLAAQSRSEKSVGVMADLIERASQQVDGTAFAAFQSVLEESKFAKAYEVLRERVMQAEMSTEDATQNLVGAFKKLEIDEIKREMSEITDKITAGTVTAEDKARYRELGVRLR